MRSGSGSVGEVVSAGLAGFAMNLSLGSLSGCVFPSSGCLLQTEEVCIGSRATKDFIQKQKGHRVTVTPELSWPSF